MTRENQTLTGARKAAILVVLLGEEVAAKLLEHLTPREITRIAREVAELGPVDVDVAESVLEEYWLRALHAPRARGGPGAARRILAHAAIEGEYADKLIRDEEQPGERVLGPVLEAPPEVLARALEDEHPQTAALVLLYLPVERAAALLASLPAEARAETVLRMARLRQVRGDVLGEVASSLRQRLLEVRKNRDAPGGVTRTVSVLERLARSEARDLLEELGQRHPEQSERLRSKLFTFESLITVDDRGMQGILRSFDAPRLAMALCGANEDLRARFLDNLSERAAGVLREELALLDEPNRTLQTAAREEVLAEALRLEAVGELVFTARSAIASQATERNAP